MTVAFSGEDPYRRSPFAGADICAEAGLTLPASAPRPLFEHDRWDFTDVIGLPVQMSMVNRRFVFTTIAEPRWRLLAKEQIVAMLAPRHDAVALLPRGYRTPLHLNTAKARLDELTRFLAWLTERQITSLAVVTDTDCENYLAHRRYLLDDNGHVVGERSPATRRAAAQIVVDLINHRELFTSDRVTATLRPWGGAAPSAIAEMPSGTGQNKTQPLDDTVLRPLLSAATYLVEVIAPHAITLARQVADANRKWSIRHGAHTPTGRLPLAEFLRLLAGYKRRGEPLPMLPEHWVRRRITQGWSPQDPLVAISLGVLARQAGFTQFMTDWLPHLRPRVEATLNLVGAQRQFARDAALVGRADTGDQVTWTVPLDREQAVAVVGIVRTAAITLLAALSGMRSSELMELQVGCCRPPERHGPDLVRYRLASRVVKGQRLGGVADEWVVIEPVYRAVQLIERLHDNPEPGALLLGRFAFDVRSTWLRNWVNGPTGQRLGLASIPETAVSLRALRRTLAIELAYRPGGMLAAKWHLKHIAVATTEGYVSKPGGAQAELLTEVNKHEADRNLELVWTEFRNYQQGIMPAGPGARELTEFFAHVDGELFDPAAPKTQASDREILDLLTKRAHTLHLGTANYCWFTDPSRALCLKLAGTPHADRPLAGMCDSARCPQATHHQHHRPVWAEHAQQTKTFLGSLGTTRRTDKARLQADYDRALRVIDAIDAAAATDLPQDHA
ncbi:site-specific integrase [Nocardia bovistercoris]|uniref:Site-specific integrase n=1 Tax=Nocardia bovistercoris TaxID=2785916 RepID=A0A931I6H2_9NOCA|nr:site-specific integrase [Nocardia bovistercoris]MBH0774692.1 site-specific integrase [Nocardia bovistercoris]